MSVFRIAWRSIQHRGFGSFLTILSMALGVMLVVSVLSIHGLVSESFRSNSSFGYNILVGARGGGLQLTLNTVYYLSKPVENIPYEYYLAFCDRETRQRELPRSITFQSLYHELDCLELMGEIAPGPMALPQSMACRANEQALLTHHVDRTRFDKYGLFQPYAEIAIPLCLGDTWEAPNSDEYFKCVGTTPDFFDKLVLDYDTKKKFEFAEGRCFEEDNAENGFYECVIGALVHKRTGLGLGDLVYPTHGDPNDMNAHKHKQGFKVVGILEGTRTPNDRVLFLNMEGFFLMEGHEKIINEKGVLRTDTDKTEDEIDDWKNQKEWDDDDEISETPFGEEPAETNPDDTNPPENTDSTPPSSDVQDADIASDNVTTSGFELNQRVRLPIEKREVTSILILCEDEVVSVFLPSQINEGDLESTLEWSNFRPVRSQKAAQAVNPVGEVAMLFYSIIDPIQWLLLALTVMICIVSAISILVGIYNSMSQRRHEIAVMRALGASRSKVMSIMVIEAFLLALGGGLLGWVMGHGLNVAIGPVVESQTGVGVGFFDLAPPIPVVGYFVGDSASFLPTSILELSVSPELLLIPGLILLAILVGVYPAISAYKTDVAKSLGK